jgi:type II secretory pathway component PulM
MKPPKNIDLNLYVSAVTEEINIVIGTLKEKGTERFGRALGGAIFLVFAAYVGVYLPPQKKSARLQAQIDHAKQLADYGSQFKDLRDQLNGAYNGLPALNDREQWLSNSVRDSLLVGGLEPESFTPVKEVELSGLVFQTSSVVLTLRFSEFYDWLLRIENAKPLMHMNSVDLVKKSDKIGYNSATCDISTVIPQKRFH